MLLAISGLLVHVIIYDGGAPTNKQRGRTPASAILLVVLDITQLVILATALIVLALIPVGLGRRGLLLMLNTLVAFPGFIIVSSDIFGVGPTFHHAVIIAGLFHEAEGAIVVVPLLHRCEKLIV